MAQRWPAWTPARIKAVLMGTADPHPDLGVYEQGGGSPDVAHAIAQRVIARRANIDFGFFRYPQTDVEPVTKSLPLLNLGDAEAGGAAGRAGGRGRQPGPGRDGHGDAVAADPGRRREASAQVTVDVEAGAPGLYSGAVVVTPASGPPVRVPVGFFKEPERYDLTLKALDRAGQPADFADAGS